MSLRKILPTTIQNSFDRAVFDQKLQDLEADLERFKLNYAQFLTDWGQYTEQSTQFTVLEAQLQEAPLEPDPAEQSPSGSLLDSVAEVSSPDLALHREAIQREYDRLRQSLQDIEHRWEAQFFSWEGFGTVFWQVVRFLGLGILMGWGLRGCAGG